MSALLPLVWHTGLARLARDWQFVLFAVLSLVVTGVLLAFSWSWMLAVMAFRPPYAEPAHLWSLRIVEPELESGHPGAQGSRKAVFQLVLEQNTVDQIAVADPAARLIEGGRSGLAVSAHALVVSDDFWSLLGLTPARGRAPRPDHSEVAISAELANAHFGGIDAAVGKLLYLDTGPHRVSGVLGAGFLAPAAIGPQRRGENRVDLILGRSLSTFTLQSPGQDASKEMFLIARSHLARSQLQAELGAKVAAIGQGLGGRYLTVEVQSLAKAMRGSEAALVWLFATVAALLALTALASLTLVASGRFLGRRRDQSVLLRIGFLPSHAAIFEATEIAILVCAAAALAVPGGLALIVLCEHVPLTRGLIDDRYVLRMTILLISYLAFAAVLLFLGLQLSHARQPRDSGARGAAAIRVSMPLLRFLQAGQTLVALAVTSVAIALVANAWQVMQVSRHTAFDNVVQIRPVFQQGTQVATRAEVLSRIRSEMASLPGVVETALASGPALELLGNTVGYRGARDIGNSQIVGRDASGSVIYRHAQALPAGAAEVDYTVVPIQVEPAFFSILGYRLSAGRALETGDTNAVVLTPESRRALFDGNHGVGERVPAPPATSPAAVWHGGLRVLGVVESGRILDNIAGFNPFATMPVVFLPWSRDEAMGGAAEPRPVVLLRHLTGARPSTAALQQVLDAGFGSAFTMQIQDLGVEVRRRLRHHVVAAATSLALGLLVAMSAGLGALGVMRLIAETRRADLAVRMAIGAWPGRVARELLVTELRWPAVLAIAWVPLSLLLGEVVGNLGLTWPGPLLAIASSLGVLGILAIGLYAGLTHTLALRPLEILREVDAGK